MARLAAVQLEAVLGNTAANLAACERLVNDAGEAGAEWIVLPEFFTSGMGFSPKLRDAALPLDGPASAAFRGRRILFTNQSTGGNPLSWAVFDLFAGERGLPLYRA